MKPLKNIIMVLLIAIGASSCQESVKMINYARGYEFETNGDTVSKSSQVIYVRLKQDHRPKGSDDWIFKDVMIQTVEYSHPRLVPYDKLERLENGVKYEWFTLEKVWDDNNRPMVKITLEENNTSTSRYVAFRIGSGDFYCGYPYEILQEGCKDSESFEMKVRYKGVVYTSMAHLDEEGCYVYEDEAFEQLMVSLENMEGIETVIMDDEIVDYFDAEDIQQNPEIGQLLNHVEEPIELTLRSDLPATRAGDPFQAMTTGPGFFSVYDDTDFKDTNLSHTLTDLYDSFDNGYLRSAGLNDKISSLAVAYNGDQKDVCAVLTVWEDSYYNSGDNTLSKHRASFVADYYTPRLTRNNLKKIKCPYSNSSWNDRISSLSFHFGYFNHNLKDH